jgi:uncharacterized protein (TIGR02246 family)
MRNALIVTAALVCAGVSAASAQVVVRTDPVPGPAGASDIVRLRDTYVAAFNAGDAPALAALYAEDAVLVPGDGVSLRGRAAIAEYLAQTLRATDRAGAVTIFPVTSEVGETIGSETGRFEEARTGVAGARERISGVYVIVYSRRADGAWRVAVEVRTRGGKDALVNW